MSLNDSDNMAEGEGAGGLNEALNASPDFEPIAEEGGKSGNQSILLLVLVAVVALGGYFLFLKKGPDAAKAATATDDAAAKETISQFLGEGNKNIEQMRQMLKDTEQVVTQFRAYPSANQVPLSDLKTNPFERKKEEADPAEDLAAKQAAEERKAAIQAVNGLQLQSIVSGTRKACMINNMMVTEGQQLEQFTVERINPDSVFVRTGKYRFELKMQR